MRNRLLNIVFSRVLFRPIDRATAEGFAAVGAPPPAHPFFDVARNYDAYLQLGMAGLEYPRRNLPPSIHFVGPLPTAGVANWTPTWWPELESAATVVHVTQGTIDNTEPARLIVPTIRALADRPDTLVVVSTGKRPVADISTAYGTALPGNVRVHEFLPYRDLLPHCDVVVTNGGYGGVQQTLADGVPLIVAGSTEDKPDVAARVAWSGAGINLSTGTPAPESIRRAVESILNDTGYRRHARRLAAELSSLPHPIDRIEQALDRTADRPPHADEDFLRLERPTGGVAIDRSE